MIPPAAVTAWRRFAPWPTDEQVEQDLALSRALVELFADPVLAARLAFRGGTALHKLYLAPPARYSEDLDLVQLQPEPLGPVLKRLTAGLGPWLGPARVERKQRGTTLLFRFTSGGVPPVPLRLKLEINTREHLAVLGLVRRSCGVENAWFTGQAEVVTYRLEELLATKLRALYQRKKGRDLFDLAVALTRHPELDIEALVACLHRYLEHGQTPIAWADFEANLAAKLADPAFVRDVEPLRAAARAGPFDAQPAWEALRRRLQAAWRSPRSP